MIIEIDGLSIEVLKKPIKNMNLRIYPPDGLIRVSAPLSFSDRLIKTHLQEKSAWIREQQDRIKSRASNQSEPLLTPGTTVDFKGRSYLLMIEEHHGPSNIKIQDDLIHFYINHNTTSTQKTALLDRWYKSEMEQLIPDLMKHWETVIQVKVAQWGIKKMKTRWGSCNTQASRIWLNLNLIKKPVVCLEYVLVHELVHLLEASHNKRFYRLMTQFMPQWREYRYLLEGKK